METDKERKSCAFTGHRPKKLPWGYDETAVECIRLKETLAEQIAALAETGYTDFLSGMAEGTDTWAALAVLSLRGKKPALKLHCVLPCRDQSEKWSITARELYNQVLKQANSIVYITESYSPGCMLKRNRYLVDHADILLAVYNGERQGGTAATVRYAQKLGRRILLIDPYGGEDASRKEIVIKADCE